MMVPVVRRVVGWAAAAAAAAVAAKTASWIASGGHLTLGATPAEQEATLPGDDLIPDASTVATRGIDIDAPVEYVWPWIAQLGQDRGGFYSVTWLENVAGGQIANSDVIVEDWQHPQVGDEFPLAPGWVLRIAEVDAPHALVVRSPEPGAPVAGAKGAMPFDFSWAFVVRPEPDGRGVRLLVRERYRLTDPKGRNAVTAAGIVSTGMTAAMLNGIRGRAERLFESGV